MSNLLHLILDKFNFLSYLLEGAYTKGVGVDHIKPFYERYSYGNRGNTVPKNAIHARELSARIKRDIRRLKCDLANKSLCDPLTHSPVTRDEYLVWRRRVLRQIKLLKSYLESISEYSRSFKAQKGRFRSARPRHVL